MYERTTLELRSENVAQFSEITPSLNWNNSIRDRVFDEVGCRVHVELLSHVQAMRFNGSPADIKLSGNFATRMPFGDQCQDFLFTFRQLGRLFELFGVLDIIVDKNPHNGGAKERLSLADCLYRLYQF